jgi:hypothetical protein
MGRIVAFNLVFFLLPFAGYMVWLVATKRTVSNAGDWPIRTIGWLAAGGAGLMVIALLFFVQFNGAAPGSTYVPPQLIDGKLIPGHFE